MRAHLGELLVQSGIITTKTLERALVRQKGSRKRLGTVLEEMGVVTQEELVEALAQQFGFETVRDIASNAFPEQLLELIPEEIAVGKLVFPLRKQEGVLAVALSDPSDTDTIDAIAKVSESTILPVLATREDILNAVRQHYLRDCGASATLRVLVVDDSAEITAELRDTLRREGYDVLIANDGVEGLRSAFSLKPDLILCDAVMPRMDGYALMRAIKANPATAHIPMILLTSKFSPEEEHRALKSGFHDFITKPMTTIRIVSRVRRAFDIIQKGRSEQRPPV